MQVDVIGIENILKYIEAAKLSKFTIMRIGNSGASTPVFECIESDSNANAVNEFKRWAEVVNNSIPYKILLFDFAEVNIDEAGAKNIKKSRNKGNKMEFNFVINTAPSYQTNPEQKSQINGGGFDLASLRADIINELHKKQEESAILTEIKQLSNRLTLIEEEEEEEEESAIAGDNSQITQLLGLINMFKGDQKPPVINGIDEQRDNINKAIKILYKNDPALDQDLLKLAKLSEEKPDTFNMLLKTLRSM